MKITTVSSAVSSASLMFLLAIAPAVRAADFTWTGAVSGDMNFAGNYDDESGGVAALVPIADDRILFTNAPGIVANMPTNTSSSARFGELVFGAGGYVLAGTADLFYKRITVMSGVTLTNRASLSWTDSEASRVVVQADAKFIHEGYFGPGPGDFMLECKSNAEFVFARGAKNMKTRDSGNHYTLTFPISHNFYMELQGTPHLRGNGAPVNLGGSKLKFTSNDIYFGGAGSGDITKRCEIEFDWGNNRNVYVEDIILITDFFRSETEGNHTMAKRGNGVCVLNANSTLSSRGGSNDNGLRLLAANGTLCVNANFTTFSRKQNNMEGLRVDAGARLEGIGTITTLAATEGYLKHANIYGTIAAGCSHMEADKRIGELTFIGTNFTFRAGSRLEIKAGREGSDALVVAAGPITIEAGAALGVIPLGAATMDAPFVILDNQGDAPVAGEFDGLPEGGKVVAAGDGFVKHFRISYAGGDGNDIALEPIPDSTLLIVR